MRESAVVGGIAFSRAFEVRGEIGGRLVIELGMKCGPRELEMVYLEWPDIHFQDKVLRVKGKAHWKFKVKDSEQRPQIYDVPDDLKDGLYELTFAGQRISVQRYQGGWVAPNQGLRPE